MANPASGEHKAADQTIADTPVSEDPPSGTPDERGSGDESIRNNLNGTTLRGSMILEQHLQEVGAGAAVSNVEPVFLHQGPENGRRWSKLSLIVGTSVPRSDQGQDLP